MVALIKSIYRKFELGKDFSAHDDAEAIVQRGEFDAGGHRAAMSLADECVISN
jgi:hypothetical protein